MNRKLLLIIPCAVILASCSSLSGIFDRVGIGFVAPSDTGKLIDSAVKVKEAFDKSAEDFTPEQEYYIGRAVGATILARYKAHPIDNATRYLNTIARVLANASEKPETFGGYHVLILDSDEINAFGAPGGFIFVTKGMLRNCPDESAVAAVLAHEISHVVLGHGLKAIQQSRLNDAFAVLGDEVINNVGSPALKQLSATFGDSIKDIAGSLISNGYSQVLEVAADNMAVDILTNAGYDPQALVVMLLEMKKHLKPGGLDFSKTHPSPDDRIRVVEAKTGSQEESVTEPAAWVARFKAALGKP